MKAIAYENRVEWLVPAALIMLSAVPVIAGAEWISYKRLAHPRHTSPVGVHRSVADR